MRKLRSDSKFSGPPMEQRDQLVTWLFELMLDAEKRELKEQWLAFEMQRLASKT